MRIRNISLRVVSLLVLTFVFVVATAVFTLFDIRMQTQNMEDSLAEEARTFAREMDAVWEFMDRYCPDSCANSSRRLPAVGMVTRPAATRPDTASIPTRCRPRT